MSCVRLVIICRRACHYLYGQARDKLLQLWHPPEMAPKPHPPNRMQSRSWQLHKHRYKDTRMQNVLRCLRVCVRLFAGCWPKILIYKCQHRASRLYLIAPPTSAILEISPRKLQLLLADKRPQDLRRVQLKWPLIYQFNSYLKFCIS